MSDEGKCRVCGCTEDNACVTEHGSCHWVQENLCSVCADFSQMPAAYQEAINQSIGEVMGEEYPEIGEAFKKHWSKYYFECVFPETPGEKEKGEISCSFGDYSDGWEAAIENKGS